MGLYIICDVTLLFVWCLISEYWRCMIPWQPCACRLASWIYVPGWSKALSGFRFKVLGVVQLPFGYIYVHGQACALESQMKTTPVIGYAVFTKSFTLKMIHPDRWLSMQCGHFLRRGIYHNAHLNSKHGGARRRKYWKIKNCIRMQKCTRSSKSSAARKLQSTRIGFPCTESCEVDHAWNDVCPEGIPWLVSSPPLKRSSCQLSSNSLAY